VRRRKEEEKSTPSKGNDDAGLALTAVLDDDDDDHVQVAVREVRPARVCLKRGAGNASIMRPINQSINQSTEAGEEDPSEVGKVDRKRGAETRVGEGASDEDQSTAAESRDRG